VRSLNILFIRHSSRADARGWLHLGAYVNLGSFFQCRSSCYQKKKWRSSSASC
jgi:hypothetical protein